MLALIRCLEQGVSRNQHLLGAQSGSVEWAHASIWKSYCTKHTHRPACSGHVTPCAVSWWNSCTEVCGRWGIWQDQASLPFAPFLQFHHLMSHQKWVMPVRMWRCPSLQEMKNNAELGHKLCSHELNSWAQDCEITQLYQPGFNKETMQ